MVQNKALVYKKVPTETPKVGEHIVVEDWPIDVDAKLEEGSLLVNVIYTSVDPYMRGRLRQPGTRSYAPAFDLDKPLTSRSIAKVVKSANSKFKEGDVISVNTPITEYAILPKQWVDAPAGPFGSVRVLENPHNLDVAHFLGALGMPGLTAYASFYEIGVPKKGETIFVTAAAGAVGQLVCQLALHDGLEVVASAGEDDKVDFLRNELGVKNVFNYKKKATADALKEYAPKGIDIFYDNVGGQTLDDALEAMNDFGRVISCGAISQYNLKPADRYGVKNLTYLFQRQLTIRGFLVGTIGPKYFEDHQKNVSKWIAEGAFKPTLHVTEGIDKSGDALMELFSGANRGKAVIKLGNL